MATMQFIKGSAAAADFFLQLFPTSAEFIDTAAVRLHREGERKKAYDILEYGIKHSDNISRLRLELAAFSGMDGASEYGLNILNDVSPDTPRYHVIKGNLFRASGQWDEAANCWKKAIESDPFDIIAWFNLGYYYLELKKSLADALQHYKKACDAFPEERRFRAFLGDALFFQDRKKEALAEYNRALSMKGGDEQFEQNLRTMIKRCK